MIDIDTLLTQGLKLTQSESYTDCTFIKPLEALINALNKEAQLNPDGEQFHEARLLGLLRNRKALEDWTLKHPEIAEEKLLAPIIIIGLPRTA